MKKLIIDSSTSFYITILIERDNQVYSKVHKTKYSRDDLIHRIYCKFRPDTVFIGRGPGSFTGLRNIFSYFSVLQKISDINIYSVSSLDIWRTALDPHRIFDNFVITLNKKLGFLQDKDGSYMLIERYKLEQDTLIFDPSHYWEKTLIDLNLDEIEDSIWGQLLKTGTIMTNFTPEYGFELEFLRKA
jgi:hypothetical protein